MKKFKFSTGGKDYRVEVEDPLSSVLVIMVNGKGYTVCRETADASAAGAADVVARAHGRSTGGHIPAERVVNPGWVPGRPSAHPGQDSLRGRCGG
jgi:hypothetical protein